MLAGCASLQSPAAKLNIGEEAPPIATVSASELDAAALSRVARIAEDSGGEIIDPAQIHRRILERQPNAPEPQSSSPASCCDAATSTGPSGPCAKP